MCLFGLNARSITLQNTQYRKCTYGHIDRIHLLFIYFSRIILNVSRNWAEFNKRRRKLTRRTAAIKLTMAN